MNGLRELRKKAIAPVYRGCRVRGPGGAGTITQTDGYHRVRVRLDEEKRARAYHPTCGIEYLTGETGA